MARTSTWTTPRDWTTAETPTAAIMNAHVGDNLTYLYAPGESWTALAQTGWSTATSARTLSYRIIRGTVVQLRGTLSKDTGTITSPYTFPAALPSGYRPSQFRYYAVGTNDLYVARLSVTSAGALIVATSGTATSLVSFEGIEFDTAN
jgi:hypothetical protein